MKEININLISIGILVLFLINAYWYFFADGGETASINSAVYLVGFILYHKNEKTLITWSFKIGKGKKNV